jgi:cell division protein FtsB
MSKKPSQLSLLLEDLPKPLRNKFIVVTAVFVFWMCFFDRNSVIDQYRLQATYQELQEKKEYYQQEIDKTEQFDQDLFTNDKTREKFVREQYYMKKSNEEVFVIEE